MVFKSWGTVVPFTQKRDINFTEQVPAGKTIGIYGYQPASAVVSAVDLENLGNYDLTQLVNAVQAVIQCEVKYVQLSYNNPSGTIINDLVLGVVFHNTQDIDGVQQILNTIYSSALGSVLVSTHMNQLNAWKAYRLNEAPENNWIMIVGIAGGLLAVVAIVYLIRKRRQ